LHILLARIVLYFLLDNLIFFLALHVKVALPKTEYLYFSSTSYVLPRVTSRTSLIWRMILSFFATLPRGLYTWQSWTYVLHVDTMCTSRPHYVYFPNWTFVLRVIIMYTSRCLCVYF
jgi:hypothetical protein